MRNPARPSLHRSINDRLNKEELASPLRRLELLLKTRQTGNLEHWLIFDDRVLLFGAHQFAAIKKDRTKEVLFTLGITNSFRP